MPFENFCTNKYIYSYRKKNSQPYLCDRLTAPPAHSRHGTNPYLNNPANGYASHKFREDLWNRGSRPVILPRKNDPEVACPKRAYRLPHLVENLWAGLKEWRAVATRYEKTATSFPSVILIAATAGYIKV
ncbi:transposase [Novacetimonas pomaceti]|uniref:transposase n=1 Tax=Novacetimonas pomaceti TaxID=2021998 RepID=UPI001A9C5BDA